jgi:hypothetical protein
VRLSRLGMSATVWPIASAQDDGWWWVWDSRWNDCQKKTNYWEKTCPNATLTTTNSTCPAWDRTRQPRFEDAPNRLSYDTAYMRHIKIFILRYLSERDSSFVRKVRFGLSRSSRVFRIRLSQQIASLISVLLLPESGLDISVSRMKKSHSFYRILHALCKKLHHHE